MNLALLFSLLVSAVQLAPLSNDFDFLLSPKPRKLVTLNFLKDLDFQFEECPFIPKPVFSDDEEVIISGITKFLDDLDMDDEIVYDPENRFGAPDDKENTPPSLVEPSNSIVNILPPLKPVYPRYKSSVNTATFLLHDLGIGLDSIEFIRRNNHPQKSS